MYVCVQERERERERENDSSWCDERNILPEFPLGLAKNYKLSNPGSLSKAYTIVYPLCSNFIPISGSDRLVWYNLRGKTPVIMVIEQFPEINLDNLS